MDISKDYLSEKLKAANLKLSQVGQMAAQHSQQLEQCQIMIQKLRGQIELLTLQLKDADIVDEEKKEDGARASTGKKRGGSATAKVSRKKEEAPVKAASPRPEDIVRKSSR